MYFKAYASSYGEVLNNQLSPGETLFYVRDSLLPILNIKMIIHERSREEFNDIDLMLLKLIEQGIGLVRSIVTLTGLAEKLVRKHIAEMIGMSLLTNESERLRLAPLGVETLKQGVPIKIVQRSFRYCAVSEQLLPRTAYQLPFNKVDQLRTSDVRRKVKSHHILDEAALVNLKGLDLSTVESKRDLNITDETISFGDMVGYSSGYLQTRLFLIGKKEPERALVAFGETTREYDLKSILPTISVLNDDCTLEKLREYNQIQSPSYGEGEVGLDQFGLPIVSITRANLEWLSKKLESGIQAILLCGTSQYSAKPVGLKARNKYPELSGLTIRYRLLEESRQNDANILRSFYDDMERYYKLPREKQPFKRFSQYVKDTYSEKETEQVRELAKLYSIERILSNLPRPIEVMD
ncbi:hypothetical protein FJM67_13225 [Maribrevibacterium harenarium]|uniref:Uncharacterized protein n=1 Tax=Maribrevibacterium harenarium TaxID=2589817 RepID=A0A501WFF6_9GAMM|nr:hypothetical protein FJM67_13225 [Maribrevibacterium harenarium]